MGTFIRSPDAALYARAAEGMFTPGVLAPALEQNTALAWELVGYLTGQDATIAMRIVGKGQREYYGFVARNRDDPLQYVVVIRGTSSIMEWLEDAQAALIPGPNIGLVHGGMWLIWETFDFHKPGELIGPPAIHALEAVFEKDAYVTVIGHSLGSALATYLMLELAQLRKFNVYGQLFASPKPGDSEFAAYVDKVVGRENYVVYNYARDLVPHLPLTLPGLDFARQLSVSWITVQSAKAAIQNSIGCNHHCECYAAMLGATIQGGEFNNCILKEVAK